MGTASPIGLYAVIHINLSRSILQIGLAALIAASLIYVPASARITTEPPEVTYTVRQAPITATTTVRERVEKEFADAPIMIRIAECEGQMRQFNEDGSLRRGQINPHDIGVFQINEIYHAAFATTVSMNIYTLEGNIAYARYLYESQGVAPWSWSSECWDKGE